MLALTPCSRATRATEAPGCIASSTILRFSAMLRRCRLGCPTFPTAELSITTSHITEANVKTEWEFLNEVVEGADCGILLDVNNIYVSSVNHGFDPAVYVESVPTERVAQIHIAGHSRYEKYILDTHDHPVIDPVWGLYSRAIERIGPTATLLEWDDKIPSFEEVHQEALKANHFLSAATALLPVHTQPTAVELVEVGG